MGFNQRNCFWVALGVLLLFGFLGCTDPSVTPATNSGAEESSEAVLAPRVHKDNSLLAFRFLNRTTGKMEWVTSLEEVPEEVRSAVLVLDMDPKRSVPPRALFIADLTKEAADGSFPTRVVDRFAYEAEQGVVNAQAAKTAQKASVVMYSAEWCGACKKAARWMRAQNIPFQERDVEKDPKAISDLQKSARAAGIAPNSIAGSVPVFVVNGRVLKGFDPGAMTQALKP